MINNSKPAEHVKETSSDGFRLVNGTGMLEWRAIKSRIINDIVIVIVPYCDRYLFYLFISIKNIFYLSTELKQVAQQKSIR